MEANTFATSAFIAAPPETVYDYLRRLETLDEWTLGSRMIERVDDSTWIGTASGYQRTLYYHVRPLSSSRFFGVEWRCGYEYRDYFKSYPVLLFPPDYIDRGGAEAGTYLHWVSVIDPAQRTPPADLERFRPWYTALLRFGVNLAGDPAVARAGLVARDELDAYLRPLVTSWRHTPGPGLLSLLMHAEGERLGDDAIVGFAMLMIFAGGETVEKTIATFVRNLLAHPSQLAPLRRDRSLMDRALAESLRYTAPTHMVPRRTNADVTINGGMIPAGSEVLCFLAAGNRDERRFTEPDMFDIDRADAAGHLSFGLGRHLCLGATIARLEVGIAVDRLLDALPDLRLTAGEAPQDVGLFLRGPSELRVTLGAGRLAAARSEGMDSRC